MMEFFTLENTLMIVGAFLVAAVLTFLAIRKKKQNYAKELLKLPIVQQSNIVQEKKKEETKELRMITVEEKKPTTFGSAILEHYNLVPRFRTAPGNNNKCPQCGKGALSIIECRSCGYQMEYGSKEEKSEISDTNNLIIPIFTNLRKKIGVKASV